MSEKRRRLITDATSMEHYVPMTLSELCRFIETIVRENEELDGFEQVIGARFVTGEDEEVPPGTILLGLRKRDLRKAGDEFGTLVIMPSKATHVM